MAKKATLLIVDRERILVDLLMRALSSPELAVLGATTADEAVNLIDLHGPDLVVIDASIQNGLPLISSLKSSNPKSKIVAITADNELAKRMGSMSIENVDRNAGLDMLVNTIKKHVDADLSRLVQSRIHVLVADDEAELVEVLSRYLISHGYSVTVAKNGRQAVERADSDPSIQIILLDVSMPEMGGMEALSIIVSRDPRPNVIMMTAVADREIARQAMKMGAFDYILKPFDFASIDASIVACLSYSEYQKQPWWKRLTSKSN